MTIHTVAGRRARILIIDDDVMLSTAMRRALIQEHDVSGENSAEEALKRLAGGEPFDLIICDLMMPHMSGMDFHAELERLDPEQAKRVVFMTGGAFTARARVFLDRVPNVRIEKPFEVHNLRALVQDLLR